MEVKQILKGKSGKKYADGLWTIYAHTMPTWMRFWYFIHRGVYNGKGWKLRLKLIRCWFGKHTWTNFQYGEGKIDGIKYKQCKNCGIPSNKYKHDSI